MLVCKILHLKQYNVKLISHAGCRPGNSQDILVKNMEANGIPTDSVEWVSLDMSSLESIKSFAQAVLDKNVSISLLINNGREAYLSIF